MDVFLVLLVYCGSTAAYGGYDGGTTCGRAPTTSRGARMRSPPCDIGAHGWCTVAGAAYPWHAVRRFIRENQGLMRRMYGEERHLAVLRAELHNNDVELVQQRYSKAGNERHRRLLNHADAVVLNTKFVYSDDAGMRANELSNSITDALPSAVVAAIDANQTLALARHTTDANHSAEETTATATATATADTEPTTEPPSTTDEPTTEAEAEAEIEVEVEAEAEADSETSGETTPPAHSSTLSPSSQLFQDSEGGEKPASPNYKMRGVNACPVKEEVVAPFWANNTRGEVLALLNLYPFEQYVHWERCTHEHRQMYCREGCRCEQQYRLHRLLAYDPNNECRGIFSDWFRFPSCCVCKCYDMPVEFRVTSRSPRAPMRLHWYRRPPPSTP